MKSSVTIEPKPLHNLPKTQYGHFIEHLGECIKGGIWAEGESDGMFLGGVRPELVDAVKSINPSLIRYPGGCFADGYHWKDGIGPRDQRPSRKNRAWAKLGSRLGLKEDNHFGTDEFLQLCEEVGAEPQLTANVGSGTAQEAADWVEYCNGPVDSGWGRERARNGHREPYNVKHWYIGNEIFGIHEIGHQKPERYVETVREYAAAMKNVDPDLKLIACGNLFPGKMGLDINRKVLAGAGEYFDYLSIHQYHPVMFAPRNFFRFQILGKHKTASLDIYYEIMGTLENMRKFVEQCADDVRQYSPPGKQIQLCFDEWNLWFSFYSDIIRANYCLRDGLWVASMLNMFHRHAPYMPLANIAQMVNCTGIINSTKKGTFLTPSALTYKIYTNYAGENLLPGSAKSPALPGKTGLSALDISATRTKNKISLFMVNRHYDEELAVDCELKGLAVEPGAKRIGMHHSNPVRYNTANDPEAVKISETDETLAIENDGEGSRFTTNLKPHSLTCMVMSVKDT